MAGKSRPSSAPSAPRRWPWVLLALVLILAIACTVLPASLVTRALPAQVHAEDFSGTLWHGSAGRLLYNGRDVGAVEWHLHPAALLSLTLSADLHWVKLSSVVDGSVEVTRGTLTARNVKGSGAIDDLHDIGIATGWHGNGSVALSLLRTDFRNINAAVGTLAVRGLNAAQLADGADLGSYEAHLGAEPANPDGTLNVDLNDAGGPIELTATIHVPPGAHTALLSGFIRERPDAAPALKDQIASLAQLRPRDSAGRIPIELEYSL